MSDEIDKRFLDSTGAEIRRLYILNKERILGEGKGKPSSRFDTPANWRKAAARCLELKADPESFVAASFAYCNLSTGPFANMMGGRAVKSWYASYVSKLGEDPANKTKDGESISEAVIRQEISDKIKDARRTMIRSTGNFLPEGENLDWICAWSNKMDPLIKVLLAYPDERARDRYGGETYEKLTANAAMVSAIRKLGYPIDEMLTWLDSNG